MGTSLKLYYMQKWKKKKKEDEKIKQRKCI